MDKSKSLNKNINKRYQKETIDLGNYPGDEYKIRKNKSVIYQPPNEYFNQENPLKVKMNIIY